MRDKITKNNMAVPQKETQPVAKPEVKPYKVFDSDLEIKDREIADYYKTSEKMLVMRFQLVGRFRNGKYVINDDMKYDLVKMHKEIIDSGENFYKAVVLYMKKYFYFDVKMSMIDDKQAKASLYLLEFVDDAMENQYIVSHIADFVDEFDGEFRIKVRKAFNLEDVALINEDFYIPNLAVLMQDEYDINQFVGNLYDLASQIYLARMLKLLEGAGELGLKILQEYKTLIIDKEEEYRDEKFKHSRFKYLLDRAINKFGGLEKLPIPKEKIQEVVGEINKSVRAIDGLQPRTGTVEIMKSKGSNLDSAPAKQIFGKTSSKSKSAKKSAPAKKASKSSSKSSAKATKTGGGVYVDLDSPSQTETISSTSDHGHTTNSSPEYDNSISSDIDNSISDPDTGSSLNPTSGNADRGDDLGDRPGETPHVDTELDTKIDLDDTAIKNPDMDTEQAKLDLDDATIDIDAKSYLNSISETSEEEKANLDNMAIDSPAIERQEIEEASTAIQIEPLEDDREIE